MLRDWLVVVVGSLIVVSCRDGSPNQDRQTSSTSAGTQVQGQTSSSSTSTGGQQSTKTARVPPCDARHLLLSATSEDGATGHGLTTILIINTAESPCSLEGYPLVTLSPSEVDGRSIRATPSDSGFMYTGGAPGRVVLDPGGVGSFGIETTHICADAVDPVTATNVDIELGGRATTYPPPVRISHCGVASVHPFQAGV